MLTAGQLLELREGKGTARNSAQDDQVIGMIEGVLGAETNSASSSELLSSEDASGEPSIGLAVLRCDERSCSFSSTRNNAKAIVLIRGNRPSYSGRAETLGKLYGLSFAETRLVQALCESNGESLGAIANQLHVGLETVRSHLKEIFRKASAHRQADVIKLVANGPASFGPTQDRD